MLYNINVIYKAIHRLVGKSTDTTLISREQKNFRFRCNCELHCFCIIMKSDIC